MRQITCIINPASGVGKTKKRLKDITKEIRRVAPKAKIHLTHHRLHAMDLAKDAIIRGAERVVAVGGDGTLNEVVNGYFGSDGKPYNQKASVAIVPSGLGSDFFRSIGDGKSLTEAIEFAVLGEPKLTDVGLVEALDNNGTKIKRHFVNISSLGISGLALGMLSSVSKKLGPALTYFMAAIKAINKFKAPTILITDGEKQQRIERCALVAMANGQYFG